MKVVVFLQKKCIYECVAKPHAVHGKGVLGYAPPTKTLKNGTFWCIFYINNAVGFFLKLSKN